MLLCSANGISAICSILIKNITTRLVRTYHCTRTRRSRVPSRLSVARWRCQFWADYTTNISERKFPTGTPHILRCCSHSWNAANASLNKALRNGGKRRRSPRELALIEACRRLRPLKPICVSTEINSSAVSPPFPTIGKGHPQAAQKPRWTASPSCLTR